MSERQVGEAPPAPVSRARRTLWAFDPERRIIVHFTDYVDDGETVDIYRSFEDAENERGPSTPMRVQWDGVDSDDDEWIIVPALTREALPPPESDSADAPPSRLVNRTRETVMKYRALAASRPAADTGDDET